MLPQLNCKLFFWPGRPAGRFVPSASAGRISGAALSADEAHGSAVLAGAGAAGRRSAVALPASAGRFSGAALSADEAHGFAVLAGAGAAGRHFGMAGRSTPAAGTFGR